MASLSGVLGNELQTMISFPRNSNSGVEALLEVDPHFTTRFSPREGQFALLKIAQRGLRQLAHEGRELPRWTRCTF